MNRLSGSRILVVGGSSGIGLETASICADAGAQITIASRSAGRLERVASAIPSIAALILDISDADQCAEVLSDLCAFDHVVVSAGGAAPGNVRGRSQEKARKGFDGKFWGAWSVASHVPLQAHASLTFVSGVFATRPRSGNIAATCVNAAVEALARGLAVELAPIRVNAVSPGFVDTPLWAGMSVEQREAMFADAAARLPAGKITHPAEVARAIVLCMESPTMTGTVLTLDGGYSFAF